jgi:hypothetical protein
MQSYTVLVKINLKCDNKSTEAFEKNLEEIKQNINDYVQDVELYKIQASIDLKNNIYANMLFKYTDEFNLTILY